MTGSSSRSGDSSGYVFFIGLVVGVIISALVVMLYFDVHEEELPATIEIEENGIGIGVADTRESEYILFRNGVYLAFPIFGDSIVWQRKLNDPNIHTTEKWRPNFERKL